jgi:hypothetical protein
VRAKAKKRYDDPTDLEVLGRLQVEGLAFGADPAMPWREPVKLGDVLSLAAREPELMEAVPALVLKRPSMFVSIRDLPADLAEAVLKLKQGVPAGFRGHAGNAVRGWTKRLDREATRASRLKSFRFSEADQARLLSLADELGLSETDVVRHALRLLSAELEAAGRGGS